MGVRHACPTIFINRSIMNITKLSGYQVGQIYKIKRIVSSVDKNFRSKLLSMGLIPHAQFQIIDIAPLGDPIHMRVHDFSLSLRKKELALLELEMI